MMIIILTQNGNFDVRRATAKYKHTQTAFLYIFNSKNRLFEEFVKQLVQSMNAQGNEDTEKVSAIEV